MARESRLRRDLPVDIDVDAIWRIAEHIGATHKQFRAAYSRALKRTAATLRKKAMADLKDGLAPRSLDLVRRRLLSFRLDRASQSQLDNFRLWFGLNAIKVKDLKGRINGRVRPHHTRRDKSTGRYIKARRQAENARFTPKGSLLSPRTFENGEVARSRRENRRTVVIRDPDTLLSHRINGLVPLSAIYAALQQPGVSRVRLISPVADLEAAAGQAPWCSAINVTRKGGSVG